MAKKLKIAVAGCGAMGRRHVDGLSAMENVEIAALMDPVQENMQKRVEEFCAPRGHNPRLYADYAEMLGREELDGIVIVTPHNLHYPQTKMALEKGLHVLLEKPMVTCAPHAEELVALVEKTKKVMLIAFPGACSPEHRFIRDLRNSGELGEIRTASAMVGQMWAQGREHTWRQDPAQSGGGQLYDSGSHVINGILWLVDQRPVEVYANVEKRGFKVDVTSSVAIKFEKGALANLTIIGDSTGPFEHEMRLYTTTSTIHVGVFGIWIKYWKGMQLVEKPALPTRPMSTDINFVNAILGEDEVVCGPVYGLRLAKLMDAIYESGAKGAAVKIGY